MPTNNEIDSNDGDDDRGGGGGDAVLRKAKMDRPFSMSWHQGAKNDVKARV